MILQAPIKLEMKVCFINEEGQEAVVTIGLAAGEYPTKQIIDEQISKAVMAVPDEFSLMTRREFWDHICVESTGQTFALPGGEEWDEVQ